MHSNEICAARLAIYYVPPRHSPWWAAGCLWLGRDCENAEPQVPVHVPGLGVALESLTREPRRYGWHATLVPPFRLAQGVTAADVLGATTTWAQTQTPSLLPIEPAILGRFAALRPRDADGDLQMRELAASGLQALAELRASPSSQEIVRRQRAPLTPRQQELLALWHYPYVLDEFRFHMTLTDSLDSEAHRHAILSWWQQQAMVLGLMPIEEVAVFAEPAPGAPFVLWRRVALGGSTLA